MEVAMEEVMVGAMEATARDLLMLMPGVQDTAQAMEATVVATAAATAVATEVVTEATEEALDMVVATEEDTEEDTGAKGRHRTGGLTNNQPMEITGCHYILYLYLSE